MAGTNLPCLDLKRMEEFRSRLSAQATRRIFDIDDQFDKSRLFLENALTVAQRTFCSPTEPSFPKTPKRKTRTKLLSHDKENELKENLDPSELIADTSRRVTRATSRASIQSKTNVEAKEPATTKKENVRHAKVKALAKIEEKTNESETKFAETQLVEVVEQRKPRIGSVKKQVKELEKKMKENNIVLIATPIKEVESVDGDEELSEKLTFVSTLSPVKLKDPKLDLSPRVLCTPFKMRANDMSRKQDRMSKKIKVADVIGSHLGVNHNRSSVRRSTMMLKNIRKSLIDQEKKRMSTLMKSMNSTMEASEEKSEDNKTVLISDSESNEEEIIPETPSPKVLRSQAPSVEKCPNSIETSATKSKRLFSSTKKLTGKPKVYRTPTSDKRLPLKPIRFVSPQILQESFIRKKREELVKKEEKEREVLKSRDKMLKQKVEELKKQRETRMKTVLERRKFNEERRRLQEENRKMVKGNSKDNIRDTAKKECLSAKHSNVEEKEKEEVERLCRQNESEEMRRVTKQKQKDDEEAEKEALREQEEKRRKEREKREAVEMERKMERERIAREKAELEKIKEREKQLAEQKATEEDKKLNNTFTKESDNTEANLDETYNKHSQQNSSNNYEMTPEVILPIPLINLDNYDISNLNSDDPTDEESNPRKPIPKWAQGRALKLALIHQATNSINVRELFPDFDPPDLTAIFNAKKTRYLKRTSSAIWSSPFGNN